MLGGRVINNEKLVLEVRCSSLLSFGRFYFYDFVHWAAI